MTPGRSVFDSFSPEQTNQHKMIKLLGSKVACEVIATDSQQGGIWIPETAKENRGYGSVIVAGPKCTEGLQHGDKVVLPKFGGVDIELDGVRVAIIEEKEILARIGRAGEPAEVTP